MMIWIKGLRTIEKIYLEKVMKTHDAMEGLKAFLEKRKPTWKNEYHLEEALFFGVSPRFFPRLNSPPYNCLLESK